MQIVTKMLDHLDGTTFQTTKAVGEVAKKLKDTKNKFSSFAEAPFIKAEVVVYQTPEDLLD
tara:strand:+ start:131 stop:313 length:183 start_codon:yes stop_codon:yes gene_type:complete